MSPALRVVGPYRNIMARIRFMSSLGLSPRMVPTSAAISSRVKYFWIRGST